MSDHLSITAVRPEPETLIRRAGQMQGDLTARIAQGDRDRRLSADTIAAFQEAGFFRMLQPRRYGGYEMTPGAFYDVQITLAKADMSAAWLHGVMGVLAFHLALFDDRAQAEVWGSNPSAIMASSYMPGGKAIPVEGGFRFSGRWGFSSGCDHCDWVLLGGIVPNDGGGPPDQRAFLVPRADVEIMDTWRTSGLKGTGSHDVVVDGCFVPEYRTHKNIDRFHGRNAGTAVNTAPLYQIPLPQMLFRAITSAAIGCLQGMIDDYVAHNKPRVTAMGNAASVDPVGQLAVAEAAAAADEMTIVMHHNFDRLLGKARQGEHASIRDRQRYRLQATQVAARCSQHAAQLFNASGASALFEDKPFARRFADIMAGRQHAANQYEVHGRALGAALLGAEKEDMLL